MPYHTNDEETRHPYLVRPVLRCSSSRSFCQKSSFLIGRKQGHTCRDGTSSDSVISFRMLAITNKSTCCLIANLSISFHPFARSWSSSKLKECVGCQSWARSVSWVSARHPVLSNSPKQNVRLWRISSCLEPVFLETEDLHHFWKHLSLGKRVLSILWPGKRKLPRSFRKKYNQRN